MARYTHPDPQLVNCNAFSSIYNLFVVDIITTRNFLIQCLKCVCARIREESLSLFILYAKPKKRNDRMRVACFSSKQKCMSIISFWNKISKCLICNEQCFLIAAPKSGSIVGVVIVVMATRAPKHSSVTSKCFRCVKWIINLYACASEVNKRR